MKHSHGKLAGLALISGIFAMSLAACRTTEEGSTPTSTPTSVSSDGGSQDEEIITEQDLPRGVTTYTDKKGNEKALTRAGIYSASGSPHLQSVTDDGKKQRVLVAPVSFEDDPTDSNCIDADDALLAKINTTFLGTEEEIKAASGSNIQSVQSFLDASSYGKADVEIIVLPCWVPYSGTPKQFESSASSGAGVTMASYVRSWYLAEYAKEDHGDLGADWSYSWKDFDSDGDGYIDLLWQVYAYPYTSNDTSFWWAYVTYTGNTANVNQPQIMTLGWASTSFMSNYGGYDSHTFIHETGHTLGASDYYDYNSKWKPMGTIDFMDGNIGDHNAYTKFIYGWNSPYILKEEDLEGGKVAEITLRASTLSGDCLVLASPDYNGSAYDEYLMVELVGPYGICENDYVSGYESTTGFTEPGLRILHVDARMYNGDHDSYITDIDKLGQEGGDWRVDNSYMGRSGTGSSDSDFWPDEDGYASTINGVGAYFTEVSLIESTFTSTDNWRKEKLYVADNSTLFKKNARFSLSSKYGWAENFMPSGTNLWNKAKTTTGWKSSKQQEYTIDEDCTCDYYLKVTDIQEDDEYGAIATVRITLN